MPSKCLPFQRCRPDPDLHAAIFHVEHLGAAVAAGACLLRKASRNRRETGPSGARNRQKSRANAKRGRRLPMPQRASAGRSSRAHSRRCAGQDRQRHRQLHAPASLEKLRAGESADEYRLRNWLWFTALSGDILVEQNIHIIDLCNWILGAHPLKAIAQAGRSVLTHPATAGQLSGRLPLSRRCTALLRFHAVRRVWRLRRRTQVLRLEGLATAPYSGAVHILGAQAWEWKDAAAASPPAPSPPTEPSQTISNSPTATKSAASSRASPAVNVITKSPPELKPR